LPPLWFIALFIGGSGDDMGFMLGNLSVDEMQRRSGVEFPSELAEYMKDRHQAEAENIKPGKWHCFDAPFTLVCGDIETATEIHERLKPLSKHFKQQMQISVQRNVR
jgi:hypothetical protein